jgi:hypothetical protein
MLGAFDVIAYDPKRGWLGVQVTVTSQLNAHFKKLSKNTQVGPLWLDFGFKFEMWGYPDRESREEGDTEPEVVRFDRAWFS